ncbi:MAG: AMP-binding protein [Hyphomicrobiales bacterium]|nr:AMP-binding protein [Hyphomicrobiales bacterium]MDE2114618.1 AMP-binding protein [Hyphomicrobiales bacterium]
MNARFEPLSAQSRLSLRARVAAATGHGPRWLFGAERQLQLDEALAGTVLPQASIMHDKIVVLRFASQLANALALLELDGIASQIVLCPPDVQGAMLAQICTQARADFVVSDGAMADEAGLEATIVELAADFTARLAPTLPAIDTKWLLLTSGTTGAPKLVAHSLPGLTGAIISQGADFDIVWATFYDTRRYGGLQMLLRALLAGGSMVFSQAEEPVGAFLTRLARHGVTHLAGTPSHWRRALMSAEIKSLKPRYLRLSGEIADQSVLNALRAAFPDVPVGHAYASTEAGVGFEVTDGLEGFPASFLERVGPVEMRVQNGTLRIRSQRTASHYIGAGALADDEGFVDTGDLVEARGGRYYFLGRASGIINVGGLKVHPEEIEAVLNGVAGVQLSRVKARKSPITGAIVVAEIVAADPASAGPALKATILAAAQAALPAYKVPALIQFVAQLPMTRGGKLERAHA